MESAFIHTLSQQGCHITLYEQYSNQLSPMCAGRCIAGVRNEFQCSETKLLLWFACLSPCSRSCSSSREGKITTFETTANSISCPAQLFSQLTIELVKRNSLSGYSKTSLHLSTILRIDVLWTVVKITKCFYFLRDIRRVVLCVFWHFVSD